MLTKEDYISLVNNTKKLTETDRIVDSYFRTNYYNICFHSISAISEGCQVSKSSIGRFLNKIGLTGFSQFKKNIYRTTLSKYTNKKQNVNAMRNLSAEDIISREVINVCSTIDSMSNYITLTDYIKFSNVIERSDNIYVIGAASTELMATYFHSQIKNVRPRAILLSANADALVQELAAIKKKDILIVFMGMENSVQLLKTVKWFNKEQATIVVVTATKLNPAVIYSELVIYFCESNENASSSMVSGFLCVDFIIAIIKSKLKPVGDTDKLNELKDFFKVNMELTG